MATGETQAGSGTDIKYLSLTGVSHLAEKIISLFVKKESGKGLSTNDYTTTEKNKLSGIEAGATANKEYYGTCSTAAATQIKIVDCSDFKLEEGAHIRVIFTNAQTYNGVVQLNVNSTGAINVQYKQGTNSIRYIWSAGELIDFTYNGTYWIMHERALATTTYYGVVKLSSSATSTSTALALTPSALNAAMQNVITGYPVYSTSATYAVGDRVRYSTYVYECITAITTAEAWTAAHWKIVDSLQTQIDNLSSNAVVDASYVHTDNNYTTTEKNKLSGIAAGAEVNKIDSIKVNGTAQTITNKAVDITIPSAVTEATVSGWGFTKNTGTYSKPSGGIPKTDLASDVQTSLGKADTALQSHQTIKTVNGKSLLGSGDVKIYPINIEDSAIIVVGTWFGETLYRYSKKLDSITTGSNVAHAITLGPGSYKIIKYEAYAVHKTASDCYMLPYSEGSYYTQVTRVTSGNIYVSNNTNWSNYNIYVDVYFEDA